jgi:hypothetical protein
MDQSCSALVEFVGSCERGSEPSVSIKCGQFLE